MPTTYEAALMSYLAYEFKEEEYKNNLDKYKNLFPKIPKTSLCFAFTFSSFVTQEKDINKFKKLYAKWDEKYYLDFFSDKTEPEKFNYMSFLVKKGWSYYMQDNDSISTGYQGIAFINHISKEIVIAHRGTVFGIDNVSQANYKADIEILKGEKAEKTPEIFRQAAMFIAYVVHRKYDENYAGYTVYQTGHSLGGVLAEFGAAYIANPPKNYPEVPEFKKSEMKDEFEKHFKLHDSRAKHANAITFDSLGSGNILKALKIPSDNLNIINYFIAPNIANTANPPAGKCYMLMSSKEEKIERDWTTTVTLSYEKIENFQELNNTLNSHYLDKIIARIDKKSGNPIFCKAIEQWPSATNSIKQSNKRRSFINNTKENSFYQFLVNMGYGMTQTLTGVVSFTHERKGELLFKEKNMEQKLTDKSLVNTLFSIVNDNKEEKETLKNIIESNLQGTSNLNLNKQFKFDGNL